ncbi:MAG: hypothetical protein ABL958_07315 [Bdellovibrionia bacterium]
MTSLIFALLAAASPVQAADYRANHCEVFIDRVQAHHGSHAAREIQVWVKTLNDRLDAPAARVALGLNDLTSNMSRELELQRFLGAENYWHPRLGSVFIGADYQGSHTVLVTPFVVTTRGTRYFALSTGDQPFTFNDEMVNNLTRIGGRNYYRIDQSRAVPTADAFAYLNPSRCR